MFCHKCGNQAAEGSAFCPKCGTKFIADDNTQQAVAPESPKQIQPQMHTNNSMSDTLKEKKFKKLAIILGAAALVIVFVVILVAAGSGGLPGRNKQAQKNEEYNAKSEISSVGSSSMQMADMEPAEWSMPYADKVRELAVGGSASQFALIDLTGSGIPELVADNSGYSVSVFTWSDGSLVTLMDNPYGAAGNLGYEYLPGGNIIRNFNNDQGGTIVYESYMKVNDAHEVVDLYDEPLSIRYYKDENSNGMMDENEPYSEDPYHYYGDTEITAEEYASYQILGDYEWITGDKSAEELLSLLNVEIETGNIAENEILYKGQPVAQLIGKSPEELFAILGDPISGTYINGDMYEGGEYYGYGDISCVMDYRSGTIGYVIGAPKCMEVNGVTLDKGREGIISALGTPTQEENRTPEDGYISAFYMMRYDMEEDGVIITVEMPNANSAADSIVIYSHLVTLSDEEYAAFVGYEIGEQPNGDQTGGGQQSKQAEGIYTLDNTSRKKSSSGSVYAAPLEFITSSMVGNVNILNPEKVRYGCTMQIVTGKNSLGMYESYTIDEDGTPGGTALTVVDAIIID